MGSVDDFLKNKSLFQLGDLPTEMPHPETTELSDWAKSDLDRALTVLRQIDLKVLNQVLDQRAELTHLFEAVADTLEKGDRIFLVGCGATGRLSLSLEYLWRQRHPKSEQVFSLMAGGDVALVHSLEGFEDYPEYGARHLRQLGFSKNDLLIGSSEGGETPYVIGAVEEAAATSKRRPFFLFCNPRDLLIKKVERSKCVLTDPKIESIELATGPMALTGSTRMQASTVLMLVIGLALDFGRDHEAAFEAFRSWLRFLESSSVLPLKAFILKEAETYLDSSFSLYTAGEMAITAFTDTTERAPTFNLSPFDNPLQPSPLPSLTYLSLDQTNSAKSAWHALLARPPRPLEWPEVHPKTSSEYLLSFDFSRHAREFRKKLIPTRPHFEFLIEVKDEFLKLSFRGIEEHIPLSGQSTLFDHLTLKMLLNMHSTLVMGRLGRFEGNLMTWVYPSNGKLVDRAARYTQILLRRMGHGQFTYDEIVRTQFKLKPEVSPKESIVHKTIEKLVSEQSQRLAPL